MGREGRGREGSTSDGGRGRRGVLAMGGEWNEAMREEGIGESGGHVADVYVRREKLRIYRLGQKDSLE